MSKEDSKISLSRRKALAGIGTIGAAAGLGGLGTFAQFTDTEETQVEFTAGGIDGMLDVHHRYNGELITTGLEPQEPGAGISLVLDDVKPGDFGSICFDLTVQSNAAWVASCIGIAEDSDWESFEPEAQEDGNVTVDDVEGTPIDNSPHGELAESLYIIPFYRDSCPSAFWDPDGLVNGEPQNGTVDFEQAGLQSIGDIGTNAAFWNSREGTEDFDELRPLTVREAAEAQLALSTIQWNNPDGPSRVPAPEGAVVGNGCVFLDGNAGNEDTNDDEREASPLLPGDTLNFGYDWHIPFGAGNYLQGDRLVMNLGFTFAQTRHTDAPELANIYSPGSQPAGGA